MKKSLTLATTIALCLALAACGAVSTATPEPTSTSVTDVAPSAPDEGGEAGVTPEAPTFAAGDLIAPEQAEGLPENQVAFTLATGETVVVDKGQRLPDVLLNELAAPILATNLEDLAALESSYIEVTLPTVNKILRETERSVVIVRESGKYGMDNSLEQTFWTAVFVGEAKGIVMKDMKSNYDVNHHATPEAAMAYAEDVISRTTYDIAYDILLVQ